MSATIAAIRADAILASRERDTIAARKRLQAYPPELLQAAHADVAYELASARYEVRRQEAIADLLATVTRTRDKRV